MALKIQIGAEINDLKKGLDDADKSLTKVAATSQTMATQMTAAANKAKSALSTIPASAEKITTTLSASEAALQKIFSKIDSSAEAAKVSLDQIGASRIPLTNLNDFNNQILKLKNNLGSVTVSAIDPVTIDTTRAVKSLTTLEGGVKILQGQLVRLQKIASGPLSLQQLERISGLIQKTQGQLNSLNRIAPFGKLTSSSNSATGAMINLGRVVQDAPFGFLGIANNLNPLLESFQRLKAESGSSKTALKALASSLMGAGGLGLALSFASAALILFTNGFQSFSKKSREAKDEVDRLSQVLKELGNIPDRKETISAGTTEETSRVLALSNAVLDQTKSYKERNNALNQLKEINKNYFGDLTLESATLTTLRGKVDEYTKAIISAATVKAFADDIGKLNVEFSKQLTAFNAVGNKLDEYKRQLATTSKVYTSLTGEERAGSKQYADLTNKISKTTREYDKQAKVLTELQGKMGEFKGALQDAVNESLKFDPLKEIKQADTKGLDDFIDKTIARARQFTSEFGNAFVVPDLSDSFLKTKAEIFEESKKLLDDVSKGRLKVKIPVDIDFDFVPPVAGPPLARIGKDLEEAMRSISGVQMEPFVFDPSIIIADQNNKLTKQLQDFGKSLFTKAGPGFSDVFAKNFAEQVNKGIANGLSQVKAIDAATINVSLQQLFVVSLTDSFGQLVDAIAAGQNAFKSFGAFVKNTLKSVITQILKTAAAAAILSLITGGASGGGMNFVQALSKILGGGGFGGARAGGGPVQAGKSYLVGENGPELFSPTASGTVFPNSSTRQSGSLRAVGAGALAIQISGRIRNRDIVLGSAREARSQRRTG